MNCKVARRRLLSMVRPDQAPDEICGHLSWCSDCREWHCRLVSMERHVQRIPVPRFHKSTKKAFLTSFLANSTDAPSAPTPPSLPPATGTPVRVMPAEHGPRPRRWIARLAAAAMSGFGWWIVRL
jgi:hypothetical protein